MTFEGRNEAGQLLAESSRADEVTETVFRAWMADSTGIYFVYKNGVNIYTLDQHGWKKIHKS